jgi:ABC-type transporter Mla MlaB component
MFAIKTDYDGRCSTFRIDGDLAGESVTELAKCWLRQTIRQTPSIRIDLRRTKHIDDAGKHLLCEMFGNGIELVVPVRNPERLE